MDLLFTPMEVAAVVLAVLIARMVAEDGESNWLEGAMLLIIYAILGMAFFFLPASVADSVEGAPPRRTARRRRRAGAGRGGSRPRRGGVPARPRPARRLCRAVPAVDKGPRAKCLDSRLTVGPSG